MRTPVSAAAARQDEEDEATDASSRTALVLGGIAAVVLAIVGIVALTGGDSNGRPEHATRVTATHPSGVSIEAEVSGANDVEITEVSAAAIAALPRYTEEEAAWRFAFDGEVTGETTVEIPEPEATSFAVMAAVDGEWRPIGFRRLGNGNLEISLDAGEAATATAAPFDGGILAAPIALDWEWLSDLYVAVVEVYENSWLDDLTDRADRLFDDVYAAYDEWADPPMCVRELAGAEVDNNADAAGLIQACVEDWAAGPLIRIGNNTRFALEVFPISGVDVDHRSGGVDLGRIGADGTVADGGETTEWTAAEGSTLTVAAEFTEYAFLRQVVTWVLDLIPGGTEYFEYAETLGEVISILEDSWNASGDLDAAIQHLERGEYRAAFGDAASALANQEMVNILIRSGFFERLGYELSEDAVEELFKVIQAAGHLADLGDLLYTAWATGGYVHGEVTIRLPAVEDDGPSTTTSTTTASSTSVTLPPGGGSIGYGQAVSGTLEEGDQHAWTFDGSGGDVITITLVGPADPVTGTRLDPVVELRAPDGTLLDENDDFDGSDSRIDAFVVPSSGTYTIVARGYGGSGGDYVLELHREETGGATTTSPAGGGTISYGQTVTGTLGADDLHVWRFDGSGGDVITIRLGGDDSDPVIRLRDPDGNELEYEDSGGIGSPEEIDGLELPAAGSYSIEVTDWAGDPGDYELELLLVEDGGETSTTTTEAGTTTTLTVPTDVGTGDVQITLLWSSGADLDLYVVDPDGNVIFYGNRSVANGGELDRDANGACSEAEANPAENVYWPSGSAPRGSYELWVEGWGSCGADEPVSFELVVRLDGEEAHRWSESVYEGSQVDFDFTY